MGKFVEKFRLIKVVVFIGLTVICGFLSQNIFLNLMATISNVYGNYLLFKFVDFKEYFLKYFYVFY
jgi:hypothetical protein